MTAEPAPASPPDEGGQVTIVLDRKKVSVPRVANETLLESARRAGLSPPFSCEAGNCGTCMGKLVEGRATMRVNDALEPDEIDEIVAGRETPVAVRRVRAADGDAEAAARNEQVARDVDRRRDGLRWRRAVRRDRDRDRHL